MSFQTDKVALIRDMLKAPAKVSKGSLAAKGQVLGGAINRFYERLERCNFGNKSLSDLYGGGLLAPNYEIVSQALLFRPALGLPEIVEIDPKQDGLNTIQTTSASMGFDYVFYWDFNGGSGNFIRTTLSDLNNEVKSRPIASILDLAAENKPNGAMTHIYTILNLILSDFALVTENAPVKPPQQLLAPLTR